MSLPSLTADGCYKRHNVPLPEPRDSARGALGFILSMVEICCLPTVLCRDFHVESLMS